MALNIYAYTKQSGAPATVGNCVANAQQRALIGSSLLSEYARIFPMVPEGEAHVEDTTIDLNPSVATLDGWIGQSGLMYRHRSNSNSSQVDAIDVLTGAAVYTFGTSSSSTSNATTRVATGTIFGDIYDANGVPYVVSVQSGSAVTGFAMFLLDETLAPIAFTNTFPEQGTNRARYAWGTTPDPVTGFPRWYVEVYVSGTQRAALYLVTPTSLGMGGGGSNLSWTLVYEVADLTAANLLFDMTLTASSRVSLYPDVESGRLLVIGYNVASNTVEVRAYLMSEPDVLLWTRTVTDCGHAHYEGLPKQTTMGKTFCLHTGSSGSSGDTIYLLSLYDGSVLDSGDTLAAGTAFTGMYWDHRYNCLIARVDNAIYACYFETNPLFARPPIDQGRARWYLDHPRAATKLRGDPVVDTVNGNMEVIVPLLEALADADSIDLLELVIDLNGHSLVNLKAPTDPEDAKVAT